MQSGFPKIWFFDMEGTLLQKEQSLNTGKVAPSAWTVLAKKLGHECYLEEEKTKERWLSGHYKGYLDWMADTIQIQKKYGLNKSILDEITNEAKLHAGAKELFTWLKKNNAITVMITGGFKSLADKVQRELKVDHAFSACEYFFDETGTLEFANLLPSDNQGKVSFMQQIIHEHGVLAEECVFVGDGMNDVYLAEKIGTSISFNGQPALKKVATFAIEQNVGEEDLSSIINFFT